MTDSAATSHLSQSERQWLKVFRVLDEAQARLLAAERASELGRGGISRVAVITGMSRSTITRGKAELDNPAAFDRLRRGRTRRHGGGRKRVDVVYPRLRSRLERILQESTGGDPMSHLRWTCKSTREIARQLTRTGMPVSSVTVGSYLHEQGFSLQGNFKTNEGRQHPDRDGQFRYINGVVDAFVKAGDPVISVDAKKKELVGEFENAGKTWRPRGRPRKVSAYDFPNLAKGKALPYGAYDVAANEAVVSVGVSHDTSAFAIESIRRWWKLLGRKRYPNAKRLLMCADGGGSNGHRGKGWKFHLQELADDLGLPITVCHYPPGTSKWNRIEPRLFSFISLHWRGEPLLSYQTVIQLIATTTTRSALQVKAQMDWADYPTGRKFSDDEMLALNLSRHNYHGDWNYTMTPRTRP